jgi:hypothetical protein
MNLHFFYTFDGVVHECNVRYTPDDGGDSMTPGSGVEFEVVEIYPDRNLSESERMELWDRAEMEYNELAGEHA